VTVRYPKMSAARLKMLHEPGRIYVAYSRYCDWIKIGFTSKPVAERVEALARQYREFGPFSLIGSVASVYYAEQQLHYAFAPFRCRQVGRTKELYPAVQPLVRQVKALVTYHAWSQMTPERRRSLLLACQRLAADPLIRLEAEISYERYREERKAA
jgi:T5orf172 domain